MATRLDFAVDRGRIAIRGALPGVAQPGVSGQIAAERAQATPFVSDRCVDNLCYLAANGNGLRELWESEECRAYVASLRQPMLDEPSTLEMPMLAWAK